MKREPANENVVAFRRRDSVVRAPDESLVDDTLAVAEFAIRGVLDKLRDLGDRELGLLWEKASKNFDLAREFDQVSDTLLTLVEDELESRGLDGGDAA